MKGVAYIILIFLLLTSSAIFAQKFNGGVLGGLSASEISGDGKWGPNHAGIYAGVFVNRYFSPRSSFQMELDFIQKGSRENPDSTNNYDFYLLRLNYVELPLHYKYDFHERGTLEAGLSLGVLIYSYEEGNPGNPPSGGEFDKTDLSFNFGAYYTIFENLRVNVRYSNSLIKVRDHSSGATYRLNRGQYNEVLSFTLHYIIPGLSR
jgi:hypothetical protein